MIAVKPRPPLTASTNYGNASWITFLEAIAGFPEKLRNTLVVGKAHIQTDVVSRHSACLGWPRIPTQARGHINTHIHTHI